MQYSDMVYEIVARETSNMDAIYQDYIIELVGVSGFNELHEKKMIEGCGSINGRSLFVLLKPRKGLSDYAEY